MIAEIRAYIFALMQIFKLMLSYYEYMLTLYEEYLEVQEELLLQSNDDNNNETTRIHKTKSNDTWKNQLCSENTSIKRHQAKRKVSFNEKKNTIHTYRYNVLQSQLSCFENAVLQSLVSNRKEHEHDYHSLWKSSQFRCLKNNLLK